MSESAEAFQDDWCKPEKVLRTLHLTQLYLWPHFRDEVKEVITVVVHVVYRERERERKGQVSNR
jgi:hypothetical protein